MQTTSPTQWGETLSGAPILDVSVSALVPALVRRWQSIDPDIDQAALSDHCLSIHLGGVKRLSRRGEGQSVSRDAREGAHSVIPAGAAFRWDTQGPVDFMHIYFDAASVDHVVAEAFDRDPTQIQLRESLGTEDPLIRALAASLLEELHHDCQQQSLLDDLLHLMLNRALRLHSDAAGSGARARHALAPFRLRRALDFIEENLSKSIGVSEIADASGISRFHFSRAFRQTTGRPPYAYVLDRRLAAARKLLAGGTVSLTQIAINCGFANLSQFSRTFKRETGLTPSNFRARH